MKQRIQVTTGPQARKLVLRIARKITAETGVPVTVVDLLESTSTLGINQMAAKLFPREKAIAKLRD
jgi:hypothetical protein